MECSHDDIIDVRDALILKRDKVSLSVLEQNLLRDCDIALGLERCDKRVRDEARERVAQLRQQYLGSSGSAR
jgi:hypothetical protein